MSTVKGVGKIVTDGLVLYLDAGSPISYPTNGTTWKDISINKYDGTLTNGPVFTTENCGGIIFDGINDYVGFPVTSISTTGNITIETFIKLNGPQSAYADIFDYNHSSGVIGGFVVQQNADSGVGTNNFYFAWWNGSSFDFCFFQVPLTNTYFHLVISKNGGNVIIYINTVPSFSGTGSSYLEGTGRTMRIAGNAGVYGRPMKGTISNFKIYNKGLTQSEVLQNYNALKGRFGL